MPGHPVQAVRLILPFALVALLVPSTGFGQPGVEMSPGVTIFTFPAERHFGSLSFQGSVERVDLDTEWEYRVDLIVTFHANTKPNQVAVAQLSNMQLVSTKPNPRQPQGPADLVGEAREPINVRLSRDGERKAIPRVTLRMAKDVAAAGVHLGLSVGDGRISWPVGVPLR